jgi:hypothetical protein
MEKYFGISMKEVYADSKLAAILLKEADFLATDSTIMDADDIYE